MNNDFFKVVSLYYPTGEQYQSLNAFEGQQRFLQILRNKLNNALNQKVDKRFKRLMNLTREAYNEDQGFIIYDDSGQFPNFGISIPLHHAEIPNIKLRSYLHLRISLLCNAFTIYYEDFMDIRRYIPGLPLRNIIISTQKVDDHDGIALKTLRDFTVDCFPTYVEANAIEVFKQKITNSIPYGVDDIKESWKPFSVYDLLFSNEYAHIRLLDENYFTVVSMIIVG